MGEDAFLRHDRVGPFHPVMAVILNDWCVEPDKDDRSGQEGHVVENLRQQRPLVGVRDMDVYGI